MDYHKTMENYFSAKLLIKDVSRKEKVIALDEEVQIGNGLGKAFQYCESILKGFALPSREHYLGEGFIRKNLKIALAATLEIGEDISHVNFDKVKLPPGRFEIIENKSRYFVVDYAHTPDALEKLLEQVGKTFKYKNVFVIFGCGGDRDKTKRPLMGSVADRSGYNIIITSDNPRSEKPEEILADISAGIKREHLSITDRKSAIERAFKISKSDDVIVIAGKGHEDYQEVNGHRFYFSDQDIVRNLND